MNLGKTISNIRKSNKIARYDFANKIGISSSYLGQIENGTLPSLKVLNRMAYYLKVPLAVLLWFTIEEKDIEKSKKEIFKYFKTPITSMMEKLLINEQKKIDF